MNILFLSGDLCDGGAQRVTATIASKLAENGNKVSLIVFSKSERDYPVSIEVQTIYMCENIDEYNRLSHIKRLLFIRKIINELNPDVAVGFLQAGYALYFASLGMNIVRIASARVSPEKIQNAKGPISSITRYWFKHANAVVLQNKEQLEIAKDYGWHNLFVIPNPLNDCVVKHLKKENYNDKCERFVMAGRLVEQKNYKLAIDAMKEIHTLYPHVTLDIFGEGKMRDDLQKYINACKLEDIVTLKGWSDIVAEEIRKYDAYMLTSNFEGQPNSLMEAMALGVPCISTACKTGPRELITSKNGILIEPNSLDQLIDAMKTLITMDKSSREKMGIEARNNMLRSYSASTIASLWEKMFNNLRRK